MYGVPVSLVGLHPFLTGIIEVLILLELLG